MCSINRFLSLFLALILCSEHAFAYPYIVKCNGSKLASSVDASELQARLFLEARDATSLEDAFDSYCSGVTECLEDFRNIMRFGNDTADVLQTLYDQLITQMNEERTYYPQCIHGQEIPNCVEIDEAGGQTYEDYRRVVDLGMDIYACQRAKEQLSSTSMVDEGRITIHYPYDQVRGHIDGCNPAGTSCRSILTKSKVAKAIKKATIMGADPYMAIAISVMEKFNNDWEAGLTWDDYIPPGFWLSNSMGCQMNGDYVVEEANLRVQESKAMSSKLKWFLSADGLKDVDTAEVSYFCFRQDQDAATILDAAPVPLDRCCQKLNFKVKPPGDPAAYAEKMTSAMMFHYQNKLAHRQTHSERDPVSGNTRTVPNVDPAHNIQYYQGYSSMMGGGEPVDPERTGYDLRENPMYGYQVMDFMMNSIMTNPAIREMVESTQTSLNTQSDSLMCINNPDGVKIYDSEEYVDKIYGSRRLQQLERKRGSSWNSLSDAEKRVFIAEISDNRTCTNGNTTTGNRNSVRSQIRNGLSSTDRTMFDFISNPDYSTGDMSQQMGMIRNGVFIANQNPDMMTTVFNNYFRDVYPRRDNYGDVSCRSGERRRDDAIDARVHSLHR